MDNHLSEINRPTVSDTRWWAGVDSVWEQDSDEAWKMIENAAESQPSAAHCVRPSFAMKAILAHETS